MQGDYNLDLRRSDKQRDSIQPKNSSPNIQSLKESEKSIQQKHALASSLANEKEKLEGDLNMNLLSEKDVFPTPSSLQGQRRESQSSRQAKHSFNHSNPNFETQALSNEHLKMSE